MRRRSILGYVRSLPAGFAVAVHISAVAAAAVGAIARSAAAASCVQDEESDNNEPNHLVVKKIAKTVHIKICIGLADAVLSFNIRARGSAL